MELPFNEARARLCGAIWSHSWSGCEAEALRVPAEMLLDKCGNEEVRVIVAFMHAEL